MRKISLKTFRKSFNPSKSKDETEFMVVQLQSLAGDLMKDDSLFSSCYGKDMASCDIGSEDEKGKSRSKSENLVDGHFEEAVVRQAEDQGQVRHCTLRWGHRLLSFSSWWPQGCACSTACLLHITTIIPTPWPLSPTSSEETYNKMEMQVKARSWCMLLAQH